MRSQALIIALFVSTVPAFAQTTGEPARGNTPPGMSQDGAGPADGAIKGGSIRPGERGGQPNTGGTAPSTTERVQRCEQLEGKLRDDCLKDERSPASGATLGRPPNKMDSRDRPEEGSAVGGSTAPGLGSPTTPRVGNDDRAPIEIRPSTK